MKDIFIIRNSGSRNIWVNLYFDSIEQAVIYIKFRYVGKHHGLKIISETEIKTKYGTYIVEPLHSYTAEVKKAHEMGHEII